MAGTDTPVTVAGTGTTSAAREHARAQARAITDSMPVVPASAWPTAVDGWDTADLVWAETVPAGCYTTRVLGRGSRIRLRDRDGRACAHLLLHRADAPWERLNAADTVKVPWQAYLGVGHPLLSDQGRVLATVVADTSGHHDALCGTTTAAANTEKYGDGRVFGPAPAGRDLLILAALKNGLGPADVPPNVSFFHGVRVDADGALRSTGSAGPGATVDLLVHLPVVVSIANTAHPLDPSPTFETTSLEVFARPAPGELAALDRSDPEYDRAVANTDDAWYALRSSS